MCVCALNPFSLCISAVFRASEPPKILSIFAFKKQKDLDPEVQPTAASSSGSCMQPLVSVSDCESHAEATVLSFVVGHSLPLAMAPRLMQCARHIAKDQAALDYLSMEPFSASYKRKHGLAQTFDIEMKADAADKFYCLNPDEAMSSNRQKVLSELIHCFSEKLQ